MTLLLRFKILRILCLVVDIGVHEMCLVFKIAAVICHTGMVGDVQLPDSI